MRALWQKWFKSKSGRSSVAQEHKQQQAQPGSETATTKRPALTTSPLSDLPLAPLVAESEQHTYLTLFPLGQNSPVTELQATARKRVEEQLLGASTDRIPRLPSVIPRLLKSLRNPDSGVAEFVAIINREPTLSAAVMKMANSAYFNPYDKPIQDLTQAMVTLGVDGIRQVVSVAVMRPVLMVTSPHFAQAGDRLWRHALLAARLGEKLARQRGLESYTGYLLGLVHDIGKITLFNELSRAYQRLQDEQPVGRQAYISLLQRRSAALTVQIARQWGLPVDIQQALAEQQQWQMAGIRPQSGWGVLLQETNTLANLLEQPGAFAPELLTTLCLKLSLNQQELEHIARTSWTE